MYELERRIKVNHRSSVEKRKWYQNREVFVVLGKVQREPADWLDGTRHRDGVSLTRAFMLNYVNLSQQCLREKHKQRTCKAKSTEVLHRGGQARMSDETAVMAVEQRSLADQFYVQVPTRKRMSS